MKKVLLKLVCLVLCAGLILTGCQKNESKEKQAEDTQKKQSIVTEPGTFPIVKDKVTLKIFTMQSPQIENLETNDLTKWYEEKTNVHIEWEQAPQTALDEKRKLSLASGDYPDVYMASAMTMEEEMLYGPQGAFIPLNDLIDKQTVTLKKIFQDDPTTRESVTTLDGNIYSLPNTAGTFHTTLPQKMWINTKWLNKLNLKLPATTDEFYQVLKAFKEKDPNGNGKSDEIPLVGSKDIGNRTGRVVRVEGFLMCAFIYNDSENRFILKDGKIDVAFNKPEWRKGLEYMKKLYTEGLIDTSAFTMTKEQVKQLIEKADAQIVGAVPQQSPSEIANMAGERHKDYAALPPLKGPDGVQTASWYPYQHKPGVYVITKACKYPEVAMRWVDWFYTMEGTLRSRVGREGIEWARAKPGEKSYTGKDATWIKLTTLGGIQNVSWMALNAPNNMLIHSDQVGDTNIYSASGLETRLYQASKLAEPYKPKEVVPPLYMGSSDIQTIAQLQTEINSYVNECIVAFAIGGMDLAKDWDKYIKNLDTMGLKNYLSIYQKTYDQFVKVKGTQKAPATK